MGTDDPGERAFLQGLIKLAAAYVHDVRGNPTGIVKNLTGRPGVAARGVGRRTDPRRHRPRGRLVDDVDRRLADLAANPTGPTLEAPNLHRSAT